MHCIALAIILIKMLKSSCFQPDVELVWSSIYCNRCLLRQLHEEDMHSFLTVLWCGPAAQAFNFAFKDYFRDLLGFRREKDGYSKWFLGNVLSGGAAGAASSVFVYSLDYARTRLTSDSGNHLQKRQFNGLSDVYRKTIRSDGILGLYRGFRASVLGIILYRGLYFGIYDSVKPVVLVGALQVKNNFS